MKQQAIVSMDDTSYTIQELVQELETDFDVQDVEVLEYYEKDNQYRLLLNLEDDANLDRLQDIVHDLDIDIEYVQLLLPQRVVKSKPISMFRSTGDSESRPIPLFANSYGTVCKLHEKSKNSQTGIDKLSVFYETLDN